jgi:NAD(P)-dependent dehydrogenase (short-subunit alcohol dehydrogenase family)
MIPFTSKNPTRLALVTGASSGIGRAFAQLPHSSRIATATNEE